MFNPKFNEFLKENDKMTLLGVFWAGLWRFYAIFFVIFLALAIIGKVLE